LCLNEITPSKLLGNNFKVKEKFCVVLVHSLHEIHYTLVAYFFLTVHKDMVDSAGDQMLEIVENVKKVPKDRGCRLHGFLEVNKVKGEFHVAFGRKAQAAHLPVGKYGLQTCKNVKHFDDVSFRSSIECTYS
jgi:hypothetical protein